jgi:hypothetical protein
MKSDIFLLVDITFDYLSYLFFCKCYFFIIYFITRCFYHNIFILIYIYFLNKTNNQT